jgi:hypothetical protein
MGFVCARVRVWGMWVGVYVFDLKTHYIIPNAHQKNPPTTSVTLVSCHSMAKNAYFYPLFEQIKK